MDPSETELIRRSQAGDREAFGALVEQHQRYVYNLALRTVGNGQDAEDLAQEAFVRAWTAITSFRLQARFRTWLFRIVTNLCYNRLPGLRRELAALGEDCLIELPAEPVPDLDPAAGMEAGELRRYLHGQIDGLPAGHRLLVVLRYQQGLSYEEIAQTISLPLGTVKTGLFRARERLRQALQAYEDQEVLAWTT